MPHENFHHRSFAFFGSREITSLYVMLTILSFSASLIGIFIPIFLYESGFPIWQILFFYFLRSAWFVLFAIILLPIVRKMSDKMMMSIAIPFLILFFLGLSRLDSMGILFFLLPASIALYMQLFWLGFHLDFSCSSDEDKVGREVGMRNMFMMLGSFAGPLAGGALIFTFGFSVTFVIASFLLLFALLPLFFFPKRKMPDDLTFSHVWTYLVDKRTRPFRLSAIGFANEKMGSWVIWPLFVFIAIGSVEKFGALYSFGFFLAAIMTYLMGKVTDSGRGKNIMKFFVPFEAFIWIAKSLARSVGVVAGLHVLSEINFSALRVPWGSGYYRLANKMESPGTFIYATEIIFNGARLFYLPFLIVAAYFLPEITFLKAALIVTSGFTLFYLVINKQKYTFNEKL